MNKEKIKKEVLEEIRKMDGSWINSPEEEAIDLTIQKTAKAITKEHIEILREIINYFEKKKQIKKRSD